MAAETLGEFGKAFPRAPGVAEKLTALLNDPDADVRLASAQALARVKLWAADAVEPLIVLLKDENDAIRGAAGAALAHIVSNQPDVMTALSQTLKDPHAGVRLAVVSALGNPGPYSRSAVELLRQALQDTDRTIRLQVVGSLASEPMDARAAIPVLGEAIQDADSAVRQRAMEELAVLIHQDSSALAPLRAALKHADPATRFLAAESLSSPHLDRITIVEEAEDPVLALKNLDHHSEGNDDEDAEFSARAKALATALAGALKDTDPAVRRLAAGALRFYRKSGMAAWPELRKALQDQDELVRCRAATALASTGAADDSLLPALRAVLSTTDPNLQLDALTALKEVYVHCENLNDAVALEIFTRLLRASRTEDDEKLSDAANFLFEAALYSEARKNPSALFMAALNSKDPESHGTAAICLARIQETKAAEMDAPGNQEEKLEVKANPVVEVLIASAKGSIKWLRTESIRRLGIIGIASQDRRGEFALLELLQAKDVSVQVDAAWALYANGRAREAIPALIRGLSCESEKVRRDAANALGSIGPVASEAVDALLVAIKDSQPSARQAAIRALKRINPEAAKRAGQGN
jgi:HEAT repeat protein